MSEVRVSIAEGAEDSGRAADQIARMIARGQERSRRRRLLDAELARLVGVMKELRDGLRELDDRLRQEDQVRAEAVDRDGLRGRDVGGAVGRPVFGVGADLFLRDIAERLREVAERVEFIGSGGFEHGGDSLSAGDGPEVAPSDVPVARTVVGGADTPEPGLSAGLVEVGEGAAAGSDPAAAPGVSGLGAAATPPLAAAPDGVVS